MKQVTTASTKYTAGFQKIAGIIPETIALLRAWSPGMSAEDLCEKALSGNLLGKATSSRVRDVVGRGFAKRFLKPDEKAASRLKTIMESGADLPRLRQLLFLYTARSSALLADFLTEVYWRVVRAGYSQLDNTEVQRFIINAFGSGKLPGTWTDAVVQRVARGMTRTLSDFGLLAPKRSSTHEILAFAISDFTARYLCFEAHSRGVGDSGILRLPDWAWFGLEPAQVPPLISRLAASANDFVFQFSGEIARFSWTRSSMEDFLNAHT